MSNNLLYNKYTSIEYINHSINDILLDTINKIIEKNNFKYINSIQMSN